MSARALCGLLVALFCFLPSTAFSQVRLQTQASGRRFEVGQSFQLEVNALGSGQVNPDDPRLPVPPGFEVQGPSIGSRTEVSMNGGVVMQRTGISATWIITPTRAGTFRLGPPSVRLGGSRVVGDPVTVEIVPPGTLPRRPGGRPGLDPFGWLDPFGGGSPFPPGLLGPDDRSLEPEEPPPVPEELRVERAPDPIAFVRAVVTPKRPVVGEQVTLRIYAYGSRGPFREANPTEPSRADFLGYSVVESSYGEDFVRVPIGDTTYFAVKLRELALFPLHAGKLTIGALTMTFDGPHYRGRAPIVRSSVPIDLDVSEPPLAGRPPGYKLGDAGELSLEATVDPRRVTAGDAVSVIAKLQGTGNIPLSLVTPERRGVEWLDPTLTDKVEPEGSVVKGYRTFSYVVKLHEPGKIDLGELTLPYFNTRKRAYVTLSAALGNVDVAENPNAGKLEPKRTRDDARDKALALAPRTKLGAYTPARATFTDDPRFFVLLFGAPALVALAGLGLDLGGRLRRRLAAQRGGPERLAHDALRAADDAARREAVATTAAAVERALFSALEAAADLRARALLRQELRAALAEAGFSEATSTRLLSLLDACEAARFTGKSPKKPPRELAREGRALVAEILRQRRPRRSRAA